MFEVFLSADNYNRMAFEFKTLEEAYEFVKTALKSVDEERTTGLTANISYDKTFEKEKEEK